MWQFIFYSEGKIFIFIFLKRSKEKLIGAKLEQSTSYIEVTCLY